MKYFQQQQQHEEIMQQNREKFQIKKEILLKLWLKLNKNQKNKKRIDDDVDVDWDFFNYLKIFVNKSIIHFFLQCIDLLIIIEH